MNGRDILGPVAASGATNAIKLLVATLAFAGAYVGVEATQHASVSAQATDAGTSAPERPAQRITLQSRAVPVTTDRLPKTGTITVSAAGFTAPCAKELHVQSVVANPDPDDTVLYGWRLQRWSEATKTWKPYLTARSGFAGARKVAEWHPRVVNNPGWYRVELSVTGAGAVRSERFQVSC
ncbi:hypothetical protein HNP84_006267 [Thermocatellispora tengchongensis]|uniref:Uncharacterized protein n=1 Tax=Thermocatellispora tengchongensis TaxID=1073253 RepID=A0A840PGA9_9ACTN|nr:hypothetical protein [Thermocatellispora tengchongensis]MBB5136520.1 hypothetical protein [Thermocatellispora tengchongensis]